MHGVFAAALDDAQLTQFTPCAFVQAAGEFDFIKQFFAGLTYPAVAIGALLRCFIAVRPSRPTEQAGK